MSVSISMMIYKLKFEKIKQNKTPDLTNLGTALCSIGLSLALCSVYVFTRRQMVIRENRDKLI